MLIYLLLAATCFVAYANGANDNIKGVASLFGSGTVGYRTAITWATFTTFLGSLGSIVLAEALLQAFSAKGLVPPEVSAQEAFLLSVAAGAGSTVLLATVTGFPISTTHSLVGGITGAGLLAAGGTFDVGRLASVFVVPLLVSPFLSLVLAAGAFRLIRGRFREVGETEGRSSESHWIDRVHFLSGGVVSFARGLNDTPKIAALLAVAHMVSVEGSLVLVGSAMALGGLLNAWRVAQTMSRRITGMGKIDGLVANLATGFMVIVASRLGVPVSTTHVSVGALFGIGAVNGRVDLSMSKKVVLSWVATLPCAALVAAITYALVS